MTVVFLAAYVDFYCEASRGPRADDIRPYDFLKSNFNAYISRCFMALPYRTRRRLSRLGKFLFTIVLILGVAAGCWIAWAGRFVVYSRDGAKLDFSRSSEELTGVLAVPPETKEAVPVYYNEGMSAVAISGDLTQFAGYYVTADDYTADMTELRQTLLSLPDTVPIVMELKDIYGKFYYNSGIAGADRDSVAPTVQTLLSDLVKSHRYIIALIPAFRDYRYGLNHVNDGIPHSSGGYLWMDNDGCYWLDPERSFNYLTNVIEELKLMGASEVLLRDFRVPTEGNILYYDDAEEVIEEVKNRLVQTCGNAETFAVSFLTDDETFSLPAGARCRLYLEDVSALQIKRVAEATSVEDKQTQLVFVTTLPDTRFEEYSVIRPVSMMK